MLNQNAKKWLEALRSGKYQQTKSALCDVGNGEPDRFCCFGVACDLYFQEHPELKSEIYDDRFYPRRKFLGELEVLPHQVQAWLGLRTSTGDYGSDYVGALTEDNDEGKTFEEIATIIESEPARLFAELRPDTGTSEPVQS